MDTPFSGVDSGKNLAVILAVVLVALGAVSYDTVSDIKTLTDSPDQYLLAPILAGAGGWLALLVRRNEVVSKKDAVAAAVIGIVGGALAAAVVKVANSDASKAALGLSAFTGALAGAEGIKRVIDARNAMAISSASLADRTVSLSGSGFATGLQVVVGGQVADIETVGAGGTTATATLREDPPDGPLTATPLGSNAGVAVARP